MLQFFKFNFLIFVFLKNGETIQKLNFWVRFFRVSVKFRHSVRWETAIDKKYLLFLHDAKFWPLKKILGKNVGKRNQPAIPTSTPTSPAPAPLAPAPLASTSLATTCWATPRPGSIPPPSPLPASSSSSTSASPSIAPTPRSTTSSTSRLRPWSRSRPFLSFWFVRLYVFFIILVLQVKFGRILNNR